MGKNQIIKTLQCVEFHNLIPQQIFQEYVLARDAAFLYGGESVSRLTISAVLLRIFGRSITRREIISLSRSILANNMFQYDHPLVARARYRIHQSIDLTDDELLATYILGYADGTSNQDILDLLQHSSICHASDKRDHVYAFLGLVDNEYRLDVDYSKTNTKELVFTQIAGQIIERRNDLHILGYTRSSDTTGHKDLPSWVPNWSEKCYFLRQPAIMKITTWTKLCFCDDGKSLEVSGVHVDEHRARLKLQEHKYDFIFPESLECDQVWLLHAGGEVNVACLRPMGLLSFQFIGFIDIWTDANICDLPQEFRLSDQAPVRIRLV
jgi:hypothetical protein